MTTGITVALVCLAYVFYQPFFATFTSVIVGGIGLVRQPDPLGLWLLIWGFFAFVLGSWTLWSATHLAPQQTYSSSAVKASGIERWLHLFFYHFDRLPRVFYWHRALVQRPSLTYLSITALWPMLISLALLLLLLTDQTVLAFCLLSLGLSFLLLWGRGQTTDATSLYLSLLTVTGWAILAGTQIFYLKDHLQDGDAYRMNTLFKFFNQVWVIWGIAAAIALPRLWQGFIRNRFTRDDARWQNRSATTWPAQAGRSGWIAGLLVLLAASSIYLVLGTPARLDVRFPGWRPEFGTLNGMDYMQNGNYTWQRNDKSPVVEIELTSDYAAIQWLLQNVRGNAVIVEAAETFYYRSGGTRVASFTGLSGLNGLHEGEQRYGDEISERSQLHQEFWETNDIERTLQLIDELKISLIYVGQLESYLHPEGTQKVQEMAKQGLLLKIFDNGQSTIYRVATLHSTNKLGDALVNKQRVSIRK